MQDAFLEVIEILQYFRYFRAILEKESHRHVLFRQHLSYDIEKMEFLCPLCETLSNTVIPIIPHLATLVKERSVLPTCVAHLWAIQLCI